MQRYEVQKLQKLPTYQICAHNSTIKKQNIFRNYLFQNFGDNWQNIRQDQNFLTLIHIHKRMLKWTF